MSTALDVLDRSLRGDPEGLSFLERTASIYILDRTNQGAPTTYGCWDFINQGLNEVERYEATHLNAGNGHRLNLEGHVQLLASMARRAARRSPSSDLNLIGTCLANAGHQASTAEARVLITHNSELRERVMGRIAAMVFDFSFHRVNTHGASAFTNIIAMESLCAVVAANSVSNGPGAIGHLVMDWIVPSVENLPPLAVAAVTLNLAHEASNKGAPAGTKEALKTLSNPIIAQVLGVLLSEATQESDSKTQYDNRHLLVLSLKALQQWCTVLELSATQVKHICGSQINIIEVLSDTLYSDVESVIDAMAELLEILLNRNKEDDANLEGVSLARRFMTNEVGVVSDLVATENIMRENEAEREEVISELVSAISLQRFRFIGRQSHGDVAVCRCLARVASSIALASQVSLRSGSLQRSANGMIDLLLNAAAHPSIHVCGIALEALPSLIAPGSDLSVRLLTVLQRRAIIPHVIVGRSPSLDAVDECGVDFHEYSNFREHILADSIVKCYLNNRGFFMESCAAAIDEFCGTATTMEVSFQLEAALFCLSAVSLDASKRALLVGASPAAQAAAGRASSLRTGHTESENIANDAKVHNEMIQRCTTALSKKPVCATSNPLTLAQMCRFLAKYANWFSKSPTQGMLDIAADLALSSFKLASTSYQDDDAVRQLVNEMTVSPLAEAAIALRNILSRSPAHFATPQALAALGGGWESSYASANGNGRISIEDREALCSGICRVLASLPFDQWTSSLTSLAQPTIEHLEAIIKQVDETAASGGADSTHEQTALGKAADEIRLISTMTRTFANAILTQTRKKSSEVSNLSTLHHPSVTVFQRAWPCLLHISKNFGNHEVIATAIGEFLVGAVGVEEHEGNSIPLLKELCELASNCMTAIRNSPTTTLYPLLMFVREVVEIHGYAVENAIINREISPMASAASDNLDVPKILERLLLISFDTVQFVVGDFGRDEGASSKEQMRGQSPFESNPDLEPKAPQKRKAPDALSGFFLVLASSVKNCPMLLIQLSHSHDSNDLDEHSGMFLRTVEAAASCLKENEADAARSAMLFLLAVVELQEQSRSIRHGAETIDSGSLSRSLASIEPALDASIAKVRSAMIIGLLTGACGSYPREVLDPAAGLLHAILRSSSNEDCEPSVMIGVQQREFLLGDDARAVSLALLSKCANGNATKSVLMDFFSDIWQMHQSDDIGAVAGGDVVANFIQKYKT